jgi:hypothetical protein
VVVDGSDGLWRDFRIGARGLGRGGTRLDVSKAVHTARAWMRRRVMGHVTIDIVSILKPKRDGGVRHDESARWRLYDLARRFRSRA